MKKFVLKLDLVDDNDKRKALKAVSTLPDFFLESLRGDTGDTRVNVRFNGIDSISMDMKDKKLTVVGTVDPVSVVSKLRKFWQTSIVLVGPVPEPEKKEEPKKEDPKKEEESKKVEPKKEEEAKKEEPKKEEEKNKKDPEPLVEVMPYRPYYPPMNTYYYPPHSMEENPNACVIG